MDDRKDFFDDLTRFANEAGAVIKRAGGTAVDKLETWRLEQDVQSLYAKLGRLTYNRLRGENASVKEPEEQQKLSPDVNLDQEAAEIISKITRLKEEIAIRKDTVKVSK